MRTFLTILLFPFSFAHADDAFDLLVGGQAWLRTVTPEYQPRGKDREETYKVFTHIYDFSGENFLTKGSGGLYTHHRGLFIGWMNTTYGAETVDTWHMRRCYQAHVEWVERESGPDGARQIEQIEWRDYKNAAFVRETRTIAARPGEAGVRVIDFASTLEAVSDPVELRGDPQHAGMQVRLANEVSDHPESTRYTLPESAELLENDEVANAWWAACTAEVEGNTYTFVHMTPPDHPTGVPVYSIRPYGRFGAFFEPDLVPGSPLEFHFRIVVCEGPRDQAFCQILYDAYAAERTQ